jgi:L-ascorbate metabolism protein UlaG (beta-lactamase superfamily)
MESFAGISLNPIVDLPCTQQEALEDIEMVIISHLHPDHFDPIAQKLLPNEIQIFCQPGDDNILKEVGFQSVKAIERSIEWEKITITPAAGRHGTGIVGNQMGNVSGFIFECKNEPIVYWAGDTVLFDGVRNIIRNKKPDVIVTHSGGAKFPGSDPIIMDAAQTISVLEEAPQSIVIATHLEALDHCTVSRSNLRELADKAGIDGDRLLIPYDGEVLNL